MATRTKKGTTNRWAISIAAIVAVIAVALGASFLLLKDEAPATSAAVTAKDDAERIMELCAGGRDDAVTSEVQAGLAEYMTSIRAKTHTVHQNLGAIIRKITPDEAGENFYKQYQECVKSQTIMHLWPDGHVPSEYLPTIQAKYSEEDRSADALLLGQALIDHGSYSDTNVYREPVRVSSSISATSDEVTITQVQVPTVRKEDGSISPPTDAVYRAALHDLLPATTVTPNDQGVTIQLSCLSGDCIEVNTGMATGRGVFRPWLPTTHYSQIGVHVDYDQTPQGRLAVLQFRRAFARLSSPTHSDKEVCEAAARDPMSPQCN